MTDHQKLLVALVSRSAGVRVDEATTTLELMARLHDLREHHRALVPNVAGK